MEKTGRSSLLKTHLVLKKQVCKRDKTWFHNFEKQDKPNLLVIGKDPLHNEM
jgi:hypothetical protein